MVFPLLNAGREEHIKQTLKSQDVIQDVHRCPETRQNDIHFDRGRFRNMAAVACTGAGGARFQTAGAPVPQIVDSESMTQQGNDLGFLGFPRL
jgi:ssDNA-binding Zn-finger/Zn-ribbon topoisomerase 1